MYERLLAEAEMMIRSLLAEKDSRLRAQLEFERDRDLRLYWAVRS
jgi:hypothetical protein